jgi:glycosyltransferase involved in cell wall biosynthesis
MKVLLATYWAVPHLGGVWTYMVQLKEKLESLGHEVDLLGYGHDNSYVHMVNKDRRVEKSQWFPLLNETTESFIRFHINPLVQYTETQCNFYEKAVKYLGLEKYDIIHTQDVISTASINRIRPAHTALVATLHGCVSHEIRQQLTTIHSSPTAYMAKTYFDELEHIGATSPEYTIVANKWLKNILTNEFNVPDQQIILSNYGYDTESFFKQMKKENSFQKPSDKKVIIFTGRLVELKGVQFLISALAKLKEIRTDWVCWIVGEGDHQAELQIQSRMLGLEENIIFLGKRDDVPFLLSLSDIFVLPSLIENQPLAVIEAQIAEKAVIVSDTGGLPEMVEHGVTGIVTPAGDSEILCKNLNLLLKNEKYSKTLGSNSKKWGMKHWIPEEAVEKVLNVYQSAISKRREERSNL